MRLNVTTVAVNGSTSSSFIALSCAQLRTSEYIQISSVYENDMDKFNL